MPLTFRSSISETVTVLETHPDGRDRVATATKLPDRSNSVLADPRWDCELVEPSGRSYREVFHGNRVEVTSAMANWLQSKSAEFRADALRNDERVYKPHSLSNSVSLGPSQTITVRNTR